jgi:hypothetical protein
MYTSYSIIISVNNMFFSRNNKPLFQCFVRSALIQNDETINSLFEGFLLSKNPLIPNKHVSLYTMKKWLKSLNARIMFLELQGIKINVSYKMDKITLTNLS